MKGPGPGRRFVRLANSKPLQGGLTGIALVALATLVLAVVAAGICAVALLLIG